MAPKHEQQQQKIDKLDLIKIKNCAKGIIKKVKIQTTEIGGNICKYFI